MEAVGSFLPLVIIALLFYLLLIRPAQRRQKEAQAVQRSAQPGSAIMLTSGIFGTVVANNEDTLQVEVAPGTVIKVARAAVAALIGDPDEELAADDEAVDEADEAAEEPDLDPTATREQ